MAGRRKKKDDDAAPADEVIVPDAPAPDAEPTPEPAKPKGKGKRSANAPEPGTSTLVQGHAARDPNRKPPVGEMNVAAAVFVTLASMQIPLTARAGFVAWARDNGHTKDRTPSAWKTLHADYLKAPVGS